MSYLNSASGAFALAGGAAAFQYLTGGVALRSIGGIIAQATLEERHTDTMTITDHPVELGAQISDHAYLNPKEIDLVIGWGAGQLTPISQLYQQLLDLQSSAKPFAIMTGKRKYSNMLISSLGVTTNVDLEHALVVHLSCREVIIVKTQTTASAASQINPQDTAGVSNIGTTQISSVTMPGGSFLA